MLANTGSLRMRSLTRSAGTIRLMPLFWCCVAVRRGEKCVAGVFLFTHFCPRSHSGPPSARVRKAAREHKEMKFTALLHHLTVDLLRDSTTCSTNGSSAK